MNFWTEMSCWICSGGANHTLLQNYLSLHTGVSDALAYDLDHVRRTRKKFYQNQFWLTLLFRCFRKIVKKNYSFVMPVRLSEWKSSVPTERNFHEIFYLRDFLKIYRKNFMFYKYLTRIIRTSHEHILTFMTIERWILQRIVIVSAKSCRENQNTFRVPSCRLWDNVEHYCEAGASHGLKSDARALNAR